MRYVVYDRNSNRILMAGDLPEGLIPVQATGENEIVMLAPDYSRELHTHCNEKGLYADTVILADRKMEQIKNHRNRLLTDSDWTQLPLCPLSDEKKALWAENRQLLRDFPATCDPDNPVWPTPLIKF